MRPATEAQLWDGLQELFGFGGYDEDITEMPYYRVRANGIANLKRLMRRRSMTVDQVWMIAVYCHDTRVVVRSHEELLRHYPEANRALQERTQQVLDNLVDERMSRALDVETDPAVRSQLMRATPQTRERVLTDWENSHA